MANIYVEEFEGIAAARNPQQAPSGLLASQAVAIGATSAATSSEFNSKTTLFRVFAEADCFIAFGAGTLNAAVAPRMALSAGGEAYISAPSNSGWKVACIERTV